MCKSKYDYEKERKEHLERIKELEADVKSLQLQVNILSWKPKSNTGRKLKLTKQVIAQIKELKGEGKTQREIADLLSISIGLVNKGCNC